jgi:hypothetical protein
MNIQAHQQNLKAAVSVASYKISKAIAKALANLAEEVSGYTQIDISSVDTLEEAATMAASFHAVGDAIGGLESAVPQAAEALAPIKAALATLTEAYAEAYRANLDAASRQRAQDKRWIKGAALNMLPTNANA